MFSEYSIHRVSVPGAGRSPQAGAAHSTSRPQAERQVYDQFQLSIQPSGEETRMKELVGRISQEIRIRPTCREIESLQAQIREGRYQPDPQEIAARMLLQKEVEYSDYLALLSELCQLFDQISHVEQQKIDAVQGHALDELNEAMKREQALTLALRGCEQKRETLLTGLGLTGISLRDVPSHCPPEYRAETSRMVEQVLKGYAVLQAAQGSARTLTELELRRVDGELARRGVEPDAESHYQASPARPTSMKTDFRA